MPTTTWVNDANVAIAAIRNIGANNLILVPGNCWTGGWSWSGGTISACNSPNDNSTQMKKIVDSANNYAIEVHQYLDSDYSGTGGKDCTQNGSTVLATVTPWLKSNNLRAFLAEFAGINSTACKTAVTNMLDYMNANAGSTTSGGWIGWTWWAGGAWYGNGDGFNLEPTNIGTSSQTDAPQMSWLTPYLQ
jgi:endoglucanase